MLWEVVVSYVAFDALDDQDVTAWKENPGDDLEDDCTIGDSIGDPDLIMI